MDGDLRETLYFQAASFSRRETKRRRISRRREIEIPNHIVEEVLVRLPVTSLIRFQTVSKDWRSLISSRGFVERHAAHQKESKVPKLFCVCDDLVNRSKNTFYSMTMTLETMTASRDHKYLRSQKLRKFTGFLEISESCDRLFCIYGMTIPVKLMNLPSGKSKPLPLANIQRLHIDHPNPHMELVQDSCPEPDQSRAFTRFGFGKDTVTGTCKLVWLYNKYPAASTSSTICEVLDLEEKNLRFVSTASLGHHQVLYSQRPSSANGSFYWLTGDEEGYPTIQTKLIVFDIHKEMFQVTETPPFVTREACGDKIGLCNLDGRLCVSLKGDCKQEFWWMVKDDTWEKIFSVDLRSTSTWFGGVTWQPLTPLAILKEDNKVILSLNYHYNLVAFDLDPHSTVYHLYFSGYYGLVVPYFPSLFTLL